jgi:hypothetical protein
MIGMAIVFAAAVTIWSPPAQAVWSSTALPVEVRVSSPMLSMSDKASIDVQLVGHTDETLLFNRTALTGDKKTSVAIAQSLIHPKRKT